MNCEYDALKAKEVLSAIRLDDYRASKGVEDAAIGGLERVKLDGVRVVDLQYPPSTRLLEGDEDSEVVFKIQGAICGKDLPPVISLPYGTTSPSRIRNLRQHVKITGFGSQEFEGYVDKLHDIHEKFSNHVVDRTVVPFDFLPYEGYAALDSHARYFTDRQLVPYERSHRFLPGVDPHRVLRNVQPDDFIHGPDNVVEYCARTVGANGGIKYSPCEPSIFKVGDLVEVAFSCVGIPVKGQRMRLLLQLRGVTLLDNLVRKESERRDRLTIATAVIHRTPKRKTLYLSHYEHIAPSASVVKRQRTEDDDLQARLFQSEPRGEASLVEEGEITDKAGAGQIDVATGADGEAALADVMEGAVRDTSAGLPDMEQLVEAPAEGGVDTLDATHLGDGDGLEDNGEDGMTEFGDVEDGYDDLAEGEGVEVFGEGAAREDAVGRVHAIEDGVEAMNVD